jgi:hypothetical protein
MLKCSFSFKLDIQKINESDKSFRNDFMHI